LPKPARRPVVYYHDPCYLARYADVTREPRQVLSRVAEVRELSASGVETECCGGGGLLPKTMPDVADAMARRRLRDLAEHGGGTVVTACATCAFMLGRNAPSGVRVRELARFVAQVTAATPAGTTAPGR
jgi:Fe-S oxidoreductase